MDLTGFILSTPTVRHRGSFEALLRFAYSRVTETYRAWSFEKHFNHFVLIFSTFDHQLLLRTQLHDLSITLERPITPAPPPARSTFFPPASERWSRRSGMRLANTG